MPTIHHGTVTSIGKMAKTVTVTVNRNVEIPKILKVVRRSTKFLVHDENHALMTVSHVGDKVSIIDGISYSLRKHFRLHEIDRRGKLPELYTTKAAEWMKLEQANQAAEKKEQQLTQERKEKAAVQSKFAERYARRLRELGAGISDLSAEETTTTTKAEGTAVEEGTDSGRGTMGTDPSAGADKKGARKGRDKKRGPGGSSSRT